MAIPVSGNQGYGTKSSITISVARGRCREDGGRVRFETNNFFIYLSWLNKRELVDLHSLISIRL